MAIKLDTDVTDRITGFKGVAGSRTEFLNDCVRIGVLPRELKDGQPQPRVFLNELDLLENDPKTTPPKHHSVGKRMRHLHSAFEGMVVCRTEYLNSGPRITLQSSELHKGLPVKPIDFDEVEVEYADANDKPAEEASGKGKPKKHPGGPGDMPPPMRQAPREG